MPIRLPLSVFAPRRRKGLRYFKRPNKCGPRRSPSLPLEKRQSIDKDHFVWAVRFQCLRHTYAQIVASQAIDWIEACDHLDDQKLAAAESALPAIAVGIRDVLGFVELTPRTGDKGGLPKSSKQKARY